MALQIGQLAPDFSLPSTDRDMFNLSRDMANKALVLYFYPKDFTPGCTQEACEFRDHFATFQGLDIPIIGISRDDIATHQRFKAQYQLPFELLSDASGSVCKAYDALMPLINMPKRITYLLSPEHKILAVYQNLLGARKHVQMMLEALQKN